MASKSTIATLNADARSKGILKSMMTIALRCIPDLAKAGAVDTNELAYTYLGSVPEAFLEDTPEALSDKAIIAVSDLIGWKADHFATTKDKRRVVYVENRPRKDRPIGNCYANALAEYYKTGNPPLIGYEMNVVGIIAHFTPHAFNYDKKTKTYYDTDHPRHCDSLGTRLCLLMLTRKESLEWLILPPYTAVKEDFAETRGCFWMCLVAPSKVAVVQYLIKNITTPRETRTLHHSFCVE